MDPAMLRRRQHQASYNTAALLDVFNNQFISNVAYIHDGLPQCLPMTALVMEEQDKVVCFLHGHPSSRLVEMVRKSETESRAENDKVRVCITATHVDGLSLSSAPNGHEFNYRSAVIHGVCSLVKDRESKLKAVKLLTNHIVPHRWEEVNPVSSFQVSLVQVIKVEVLSGSVKSRTGVPQIQPRNPEKDGPNIDGPVWTGVIPLYQTLGQPIPGGLRDYCAVPPSVDEFILRRNKAHQGYAELAARKKL